MSWCGLLWVYSSWDLLSSWTFKFMSFDKFERFLAIISSIFQKPYPFPALLLDADDIWDYFYITIGYKICVLLHFKISFLCCSDWESSIIMCFSSLPRPVLLLSHPWSFLCQFIFQLQDFHLFLYPLLFFFFTIFYFFSNTFFSFFKDMFTIACWNIL